MNKPTDNPFDAPPELLAQAYRIALYFAERGVKDWRLGPIQKQVGPGVPLLQSGTPSFKPVPMEHRDPPSGAEYKL